MDKRVTTTIGTVLIDGARIALFDPPAQNSRRKQLGQ
jgi:hypothetical protein